MNSRISFVITGSGQRPMLSDLSMPENENPPVVIFIHGYKGFKDWGHFPLIADHLCKAGFAVLRYNGSHNGTSPETPVDFSDLDAFGRNNYSIELNDLNLVVNALFEHEQLKSVSLDHNRIYLLGHSRGGGIAILQTANDKRVNKLVTWASISDISKRVVPGDLEKWKADGVRYERNARTGQNMPIYFQLYEDFESNREKLNIQHAISRIKQPVLIVHGSADESVPVEEAFQLCSWCSSAQCSIIEGAQHTFGGKHPYDANELPAHTSAALQATIRFLLSEDET